MLVYFYSNPFTTLTNAFFKHMILEHISKEREAFSLLSVTNIKIQSILLEVVILLMNLFEAIQIDGFQKMLFCKKI